MSIDIDSSSGSACCSSAFGNAKPHTIWDSVSAGRRRSRSASGIDGGSATYPTRWPGVSSCLPYVYTTNECG